MTDYTIDFDGATRIKGLHVQAYDAIVATADTVPEVVDGCDTATPYLHSILSLIIADAHSLAVANADAADLMAETIRGYANMETSASDQFAGWAESLGPS